MTDTISELRLALRAAGHAPVPACGKAVYLQEWSTKGAASAGEVAAWSVDHPDWSNTGVLSVPRLRSTLIFPNPEAVEAVADMVSDWFDGRGTILTRTGQAPKRAVPFRTEQPFQKIRIQFVKPEGSKEKEKPPAIEMLAHGQQFIVDGIHPDTRRPYSWHAERTLLNTPRQDLPEINEAEAQSLVTLVAEMLVEKFGFQVDTNSHADGDMFEGRTNGANGRTNGKTDAVYDDGGRLDVEASLAAMQPNGASVNDIQPKVTLALLQRAIPPAEVIDRVVNHTMEMANRANLGWTREVEIECASRRVKTDLSLLHREYDPSTGEIPRWLAEEFHEAWAAALSAGQRPYLFRNRYKFCVKAVGPIDREPQAEAGPEVRSDPRDLRFRIVSFKDMRPGIEPLYLIDELIPVRGLVDIWASQSVSSRSSRST
jgi:hypothetical protein